MTLEKGEEEFLSGFTGHAWHCFEGGLWKRKEIGENV